MRETALKPYATFDVDGTIFKSSLAEKVVEGGIASGLFKSDAFNDVHANRRRWQEDNSEDAYVAYIHRLVGALVSQMAGVEVQRFNGVVAELVERHQARRFKFPRQLMHAVAQTHHVVAISGSPRIILEPFLADLPIHSIYGSEFMVEDGRFTGEAQGVGDKAAILQNLEAQGVVTAQGSIATGDTAGDIPALEHAELPVMFNPSLTLARHGERKKWDQVLEVKDRMLVLRHSEITGHYRPVDTGLYIQSLH